MADILSAVSVFGGFYHNAHFVPPGSGVGGEVRVVTSGEPTSCWLRKQKPATRAGFLKSGAGLGIDVFCYFDDLHVYFQV